MCGTSSIKLKNETGREKQLRFYELTAVLVLKCGFEIWALDKADRGGND
jgi:hypothetical protein